MVAVCEGEGAHLALRDDLEVDVMIGAKGLQYGIETLPRPPQELAQPLDGNTVVVGVEAMGGGLTLSPEGVGLDESGTLLLVVKPGAQGLADGGVARRVAPSRSGAPVEITIEALDEVVAKPVMHSFTYMRSEGDCVWQIPFEQVTLRDKRFIGFEAVHTVILIFQD